MATLVASSSSMRVRKDACQKDLRFIYAAVDPLSHSIFSFQFQVYAKTNLEAKMLHVVCLLSAFKEM